MDGSRINDAAAAIDREGWWLLRDELDPEEVAALCDGLAAVLSASTDESAALRSRGAMYAARNVLEFFPPASDVMFRPRVHRLLSDVLGSEFGLVRGLFFDKPPGRTWSLPWHKDQTIAVIDNTFPSTCFIKPTFKAGVPHVEAPRNVLEAMLTLRIHLDEITDENGPLKLIPSSHQRDCENAEPVTICSAAGDILVMRPLVTHASGESLPDTQRHRRILHLEFAASPLLPDGYRWHTFLRGSR